MDGNLLLFAVLAAPAVFAGVSLLLRSARAVVLFCAVGTALVALLAGTAAWGHFSGQLSFEGSHWLMLDALSAFHVGIMITIFTMSALFGVDYFRGEIQRGEFTRKMARRYGALWFGSMGAMLLVLLSNNLVVMWVGIEATTLLTAFLICTHVAPASLEAMWKYLIMCSVGVAVAFMGTLLVAASTANAGLHGTDALMWTSLMASASDLNPALMKAGFIFIVVGFGTKAGLAPMHNWLPDAHSQAPSPVSAVFSGFLLNAAFFCILKYLPIVEGATGNTGWGHGILAVLGLLSILVAAVFIAAQKNVKRLLAYCSVEHMGIIALGIGLGGAGCFAGLLHMLNHSLSKMLSFFCAGRLGQAYGTQEMRQMTGVIRTSRCWGTGLVASMLALIGVAPFSLFLSEFLILKSAWTAGNYLVAGAFLAGLAIVFMGMLRNIMPMAWEPQAPGQEPVKDNIIGRVLVYALLAAMLLLGMWIPQPLSDILNSAAKILGGGI